jgi:RNA polymerase sigma factor (sigma-70 family)
MREVEPQAFVPDRTIVEGIRAANEDAQKLLWAKYAPWLMRTARQTGLSEQDAEEVVSDVFFRILQRIAAGRTGDNVGPFLRVATRNAAIAHYRQNRPQLEHEVLASNPDEEGGASQEPVRDESADREGAVNYRVLVVRQALEKLSPRDQEILGWIAYDATNEELADWSGTNLNHARQLRRRARGRLSKAIMSVIEDLPLAARQRAREKIFGVKT